MKLVDTVIDVVTSCLNPTSRINSTKLKLVFIPSVLKVKRLVDITAAVLAISLLASDTQAALADRSNFPSTEWPYLYYVTTAASVEEEREPLEAAIKLVVASTSLQPILERCVPDEVTPTLFRIDLRDMKWRWQDWHKVIATYPYTDSDMPLMVRADWLLTVIADGHETNNYQQLLFEGTPPKTRDEWLQRLNVGTQSELRFGLVEGQSGVSKQGIRWIENRPIARGYAWGTRDVLTLVAGKDPLASLLGDFKHDGEEWIVGIPKVSLTTGKRGALQVYALSNGEGKLVTRAPVDLVEDETEFRGLREIRVAGSCIQCHGKGLNNPTQNELRTLITAGADVYSYPRENAEQIEQFHLGDITTELTRNQEDYATAVQFITGLTPIETALCFKTSVDTYDAMVTMERAAYELSTNTESLKLALGYYSAHHTTTPARVTGLASGLPIPRDSFEEHFMTIKEAVRIWESNQ